MKTVAAIVTIVLGVVLLTWIDKAANTGLHFSLDGVEHVLVIR